jgi:predicted flap endonuclease-1-like 5' DNA nuclease
VILGALVLFVIFFLWWWVRSHDEEEDEGDVVLAKPEPAAVEPEPEIERETVAKPPVVPDDLKRIEGIGPKIEGVLQAAGINTFADLANLEVGQIEEILRAADPNLIRLAVPTTWPQQAKLASEGDWDALEQLQDKLKGGKHS